jgi:uncharacterized membrane protein YhiD involved in acid resistance
VLIYAGIGLVIGLEREFSNKKELFAGLRTLSIVSLLGFTFALLNFMIHPWLFIFGFTSIVMIISISY